MFDISKIDNSPLSDQILKMLQEHHRGCVKEEDCIACSSACCSHGGFAILENVMLIYEEYLHGNLHREDYVFDAGLSFREFTKKFFDIHVVSWKRNLFLRLYLVKFHMKSLTPKNELISIPTVGYFYETRLGVFNNYPWLNKGCIFLSKKVPNWPKDDGDKSRHCILHKPLSGTHLTTKPIDCLFFTCTSPREPKMPRPEVSHEWYVALNKAYPNSMYRTDDLLDEDK